jgi:hypothetical protein
MSYQESMQAARGALLRTVAYFDAIDYAPTWPECSAWFEGPGSSGFEYQSPPSETEFLAARDSLREEGVIECDFGRVALNGRLATLASLAAERTALFARKIRRARRVVRWLARQSGVRFVALANTTALANARDFGDLDFFVVVRDGTLWSTRLLSAGLYKLLGRLPGAREERDAVCLSYFVSDAALDLSGHMLPGDDPYFRYWFLSLLPLADDGVSRELWQANRAITAKHPHAEQWMTSPDLSVRFPRIRIPTARATERMAERFQRSWFPKQIKDHASESTKHEAPFADALRAGRGTTDTSVIVSDKVLKFHVEDGRVRYRAAYQECLHKLGLL